MNENLSDTTNLDLSLNNTDEQVEDLNNENKEVKKQNQIKSRERLRIVDKFGRAYATGRRKTSVSRLWLKEGTGKFIVNDKPLESYFTRETHRNEALMAFRYAIGKFDIMSTVKGGGISGQAGAFSMALSRAIINFNPEFYQDLRNAGLCTRDSRIKERRKVGHRGKARKKPQYSKR